MAVKIRSSILEARCSMKDRMSEFPNCIIEHRESSIEHLLLFATNDYGPVTNGRKPAASDRKPER